MQINPEAALTSVEQYISRVDELLGKSYKEGQDEKREMDTSIQNFIRTTFVDDENKLKDYRSSVFFIGFIDGREETDQEKQDDYISRLKTMRNHLIAFRDEIKLKLSTNEKTSQLDKIEEETEIRDAEARRRASVVEGKLWGAVIELLDMQRNELKKKDELNKAMIEIKKEINDVKTMFLTFAEKESKK